MTGKELLQVSSLGVRGETTNPEKLAVGLLISPQVLLATGIAKKQIKH